MAAGLGFKTFTSGEVLTAADTNGYLMQGILVFANASARTAAITSPQEGQYSYLKDTNSTEYYDGAAWVAGVEGDISGVTAGTGISGGGTSGTVTVTNSMATTMTTKGDLVPATGSGTFARLAAGANDTFLVADSATATGLRYGGTWTTWTPTFTNLTVGNGTTIGRYQQVGKIAFYFIKFTMGTTSVVSGDVYFTLPVGTAANGLFNGVSEYIDTGTADYGGTIELAGSAYFRVTNVAGTYANYSTTLNATRPFTWGSTDVMSAYGWYEVA